MKVFTTFISKIGNNQGREQPDLAIPPKTPQELFQELKDLSAKSVETLTTLSDKEELLKQTQSWNVKIQTKKEMQILLTQFVSEVDNLIKLRKQYRKYLETLPDAKEKCKKLDDGIQAEEKSKESVIEKVKNLTSGKSL